MPLIPRASALDGPDDYRGDPSFFFSCKLALIVARFQSEVQTLERYGSAERTESCEEIEHDLSELRDEVRAEFALVHRSVGMGQSSFVSNRAE